MYSLYDPIFLFMLFVLSVCISVVGMNVDFWVFFFSWQFYHCQLIVTSCYIFPSTNLKHNYIQRGKNAKWNKLPFIFFVVVSVFSTKSQMPCDFLVVSFPDGSSIRNWKILKSLSSVFHTSLVKARLLQILCTCTFTQCKCKSCRVNQYVGHRGQRTVPHNKRHLVTQFVSLKKTLWYSDQKKWL